MAKSKDDILNVTRSYLPPLSEYVKKLEVIWDTCNLTNNGPMAQQLESQLRSYLGVKHCLFVSNGTIALQLAIRALDLKKEIITTPFTYVATSTSILWEHCKPIFVDIDPLTLCLDPKKVRQAINSQTEAILGVHVFGNPCAVKEIAEIAREHRLKVIYDGAHAMGAKLDGESLFQYGDISTLSFHATKLFHTVEGGAIITNDDELARKLFLYRSFGHLADDYQDIGINAKNSELHAAMGLCNFDSLGDQIKHRRGVHQKYDQALRGLPLFRPQVFEKQFESNFSYYPVFFRTESEALRVKSLLAENQIFARRYFYPSLNTLPYMQGGSCPHSEDISGRILCLPFSSYTESEDVERVSDLMRKAFL